MVKHIKVRSDGDSYFMADVAGSIMYFYYFFSLLLYTAMETNFLLFFLHHDTPLFFHFRLKT